MNTDSAGPLTGCAGAGPHNLLKPAQYCTIPKIKKSAQSLKIHCSENIVEIVMKQDISIDHHDF